MIPFTIEIFGLKETQAALTGIDRHLESLKPLWERFAVERYTEERKLFDSQPWAPLSPAYAKRKQELVGSKTILRFRDALFKSFTEQGAEGNVHRVNDLSAEFGSSDFKAILHASGTSRMPARNPSAEPNEEQYATIAGEYLGEILARAGFN